MTEESYEALRRRYNALRSEVAELSTARYTANQQLSKLQEENAQLRAAVEFELNNLREVVNGIEGAL